MSISELSSFSLVGGTALSLMYGHRSSIDLDLFSFEKKDFDSIIRLLQEKYGTRFVYMPQPSGIGLFSFIDQIKIDFINYPHTLIGPANLVEGVRIYSIPDLAAMKIQAIIGRAQKKDFWDIYELLQHYSISQLSNWHHLKYPGQMLAITIPHAITYFADAENSQDPISLKNQTWEMVKKGIQNAVSDFLK